MPAAIVEASGMSTVTLELDRAIPATQADLSFPYSITGIQAGDIVDADADGDGNALTGTLVVRAGDRSASFTVTAMQDSIAESGGETMTITLGVLPSNASGTQLTASGTSSTQIMITDDDTAGVTVEPTMVMVAEGGAASYRVVLNTQPSSNVTITITSNNTDVTVSPSAPLTFTTLNWNTAQVVTVNAAEDGDSDNDSAMLTHAVSGYGSITTAAAVAVTVTDNDTPGVRVDPTSLVVDEGSTTGTYRVRLNTQPAGDVTIMIASNNTDVTVDPSSLTFTRTNWNFEQMVRLTAAQDGDAVNDRAMLTHTVSGYGTVTTAPAVNVTVTDDDETAGVPRLIVSLSTEAGGDNIITEGQDSDDRATITVTLVNIPEGITAANVDFSLTVSGQNVARNTTPGSPSADNESFLLTLERNTFALPTSYRIASTVRLSNFVNGMATDTYAVDSLLDSDTTDETVYFEVDNVAFEGGSVPGLRGVPSSVVLHVIDADATPPPTTVESIALPSSGPFSEQDGIPSGVRFVLTLDRRPESDLEVDFSFSGSGVTDGDFEGLVTAGLNTSLLHPPSQCFGDERRLCQLDFAIVDDDVVERAETVTLRIDEVRFRGNPLTLPSDPTVSFVVMDNDTSDVNVAVTSEADGDISITEGRTSDDRATITVSLNTFEAVTSAEVDYTFAVTGATAALGDVRTTPNLTPTGTLTVNNFNGSGRGSISINVDALADSDSDFEQATLTVTGVRFMGDNVPSLRGLPKRGTVNILDALTPRPGVAVAISIGDGIDEAITEGDTDDDRATITVAFVNIPPFTTAVDMRYTFGITSSRDPIDEIATTPRLSLRSSGGTLRMSNISSDTASVSITVDALPDNDVDNEVITFTVNEARFIGSGTLPLTGLQQRTVIRVNDAGHPTRLLSITALRNASEQFSFFEGQRGVISPTFRFVLDRAPADAISVFVRISGNNVTPGDFIDVRDTRQYEFEIFPNACDGTSCTLLQLTIRDDNVVEGTETVIVDYIIAQRADGGILLPPSTNGRTTFTIMDDD